MSILQVVSAFVFFVFAPMPVLGQELVEAQIVRVVDGDTVVCAVGGEKENVVVRMIGIDAPEAARRGQERNIGAEKAWECVRGFVGASVWLEMDTERTDKYGRALAYIWVEKPGEINTGEVAKKMLNARLVAAGLAETKRLRPNIKYAEYLKILQRVAKADRIGIWENK
jgi:micrococcal nuclease